MLFSDFSNSWVGLTLQLRQLLFWDQKTRNSALVAARFPSGISLKMTICLGRVQSWVPWDETSWVVSVWVVAGVNFFGQSGRSSLRPICWTCWGLGSSVWVGLKAMQGDQGDSNPFFERRCARNCYGFSVETWIKKYLTLVYMAVCIVSPWKLFPSISSCIF